MPVRPRPPLEVPARHFLMAAIGWLELGNPAEARAELDALPDEARWHPDVLEVRWQLCAQARDWTAAVPIARALVEAAPERTSGWLHFAYALRRVPEGGLAQAQAALRPAHALFPQEPLIPYNLACYACQLGQLDEARDWLRRAAEVGDRDKVRRLALADDDLQPLWNELGKK